VAPRQVLSLWELPEAVSCIGLVDGAVDGPRSRTWTATQSGLARKVEKKAKIG